MKGTCEPSPSHCQVKRESNQLYGLKVMGIMQLSKWMALAQFDKIEPGSPKPHCLMCRIGLIPSVSTCLRAFDPWEVQGFVQYST